MNLRLLIAIFVTLLPVAAGAQTLTERGLLEFPPDVEVIDFAAPEPAVKVWELGSRETDVATLLRSDSRPLTGAQVLPVGGRMSLAAVDLAPLQRFEGRRVEIKLWYRPDGTDITAELYWFTDPADLRRDSHLRLPLQHTGRATSDGWRELSTGPIDWSFQGDKPVLRIEDGTVRRGRGFLGEPSPVSAAPDARAALDALSITDLGPAVTPDAACGFPTQKETCGEGAVCYAGRCADARVVVGAPPLTTAGRRANVDRRYFLFEAFHAERSRTEKLPELRADLDALFEGPAAEFYPAMQRAIRKQSFGHGLGPGATALETSLGICMGPGTADMLPGSPQLPLVFWVDSDEPGFEGVALGDALVAIDGVDVATWQALDEELALTRYSYYDEFVRQSELGDAAALRGSILTFQRCSRVDGQPCEASELESYDVDTAELFGSAVRRGQRPRDHMCDMRFERPEGFTPNGFDNDAIGVSSPATGVKLIAFNGFFPSNQQGWTTNMRAALEGPVDGLIYDTRMGGGGQGRLIPVVTSPVVDASVTANYPGLFDVPLDDADLRARIDACVGSSTLACLMLGGPFPARDATADAPLSSIPVALMLGHDGSANDFFPLALQERAAPLLMIGSNPTFGWFGTVLGAPFLDGELAGPVIQAQDTYRTGAPGEPLASDVMFLSGGGIAPDEVCLQTQSDATRGIDTCIGRAVEWLQNQ